MDHFREAVRSLVNFRTSVGNTQAVNFSLFELAEASVLETMGSRLSDRVLPLKGHMEVQLVEVWNSLD